MGYRSYSVENRTLSATSAGYYTKDRDDIFKQNKLRKLHDSMNPKDVLVREACDSKEHPTTVPVQVYLDVTGSMREVPHEMIKDGLPTLIGNLIQNGVKDVALMFGAIGDHECDHAPLQIGQFESGDAEMDMWLERVWLEGGGGGNNGESYLLAWYFAGNHTRTDAFDKRGEKGFIFTIGDEPCLENLPVSAVKGIMGKTAVGQGNYTREALLKKALEQNHVYHIHVNHHGDGEYALDPAWKTLLGQNVIEVDDYTTISKVISDIIMSHMKASPIKPQEPSITL